MKRRDALRSLTGGCLGFAVHDIGLRAFAQTDSSELLIRRGRIVNASGIRDADVRIVGATVAEIGVGLKPRTGARVIDAAGHLVLPGGVDPHTHLHPSFVDDLTSGSMAAFAGGLTTIGTFATAQQNETLTDAIERMAARVRAEAIADVFLHASAWPPTPEVTAAMPAIAAAGQPSSSFHRGAIAPTRRTAVCRPTASSRGIRQGAAVARTGGWKNRCSRDGPRAMDSRAEARSLTIDHAFAPRHE